MGSLIRPRTVIQSSCTTPPVSPLLAFHAHQKACGIWLWRPSAAAPRVGQVGAHVRQHLEVVGLHMTADETQVMAPSKSQLQACTHAA